MDLLYPRLVDSWTGMVSMGCYTVRYKSGPDTLVLDSKLGLSVPSACLDYCALKSVELVVGLVRVASESELGLQDAPQSGFVCSCGFGVSRLIKTEDRECNVRCQASNRLSCGSAVDVNPVDQMDLPLVPTSVYSRFLDYAPTQGSCFPRSITLDMDMSRFRLPQKSIVPSVLSRPGECLSVCVSVTDINQKMFALIAPNLSDPARPSTDCLCVVLSQLELMVLQMYSIDQSQCDSPCDASSGLVCGSPSSEAYSLYSLPPPDKMISNFIFNPPYPSPTDIPSETAAPVPTISNRNRFFTTDVTSSLPPQEKASGSAVQKSTIFSQTAAPSIIPTTTNRGGSSMVPTLSNGQQIPQTSTSTSAPNPSSSKQPQLNAIITDDTPDDIDVIVTSRVGGTVLTFKMSKTAAQQPTIALVSPSLGGIPSEKSPGSNGGGASSMTTAAIASSVGILLVAFLLVANFTAIKVRRERRKSGPVTVHELHDSMDVFKDAEFKSPADMYYSAHRPTAITAESPRVRAQTLELSNTNTTAANINTSLSFLDGGPIGMPRLSSQYYATTPSLPRLLALNLDGSVPGKGKQSLQIDRRSMGSKYHVFGTGASTQLGAMYEEEPVDLDAGEEKDQTDHIIAAYRTGILARESETSLVSSLNSSTQLGAGEGELKKSESSVYMDVLSGNDELEQRWL
ncbi:hypothetical protein BJ741DRAFT_598654 [Chytriomyces cf. hyalinus JEL632]|nr:hypothetical protein BJ741DRAFT_598654 [Chytriomyces cf. hyalinus JEL632]